MGVPNGVVLAPKVDCPKLVGCPNGAFGVVDAKAPNPNVGGGTAGVVDGAFATGPVGV